MKRPSTPRVFAARTARTARRVSVIAASVALLGLASARGASDGSTAAVAGDGQRVTLAGHLHPLAQPRFDVGEAPNGLAMASLELELTRTPAQQRALDQLLTAQQDPKSPQYHQWLTPAQFGVRFGANNATLATLSGWLTASGFKVGNVPAGRGHLPFSGTKSQLETAFATPIHLFNVGGVTHFANVANPQVPAAIAPMIAAIRGLHDFYPKPASRRARNTVARGDAPAPQVSYTNYYPPGLIGPTDFAIIYNVQPLYQSGLTGAGVTVAIAAQSDLDPTILTTYWSGFGVSGPSFGLPAQQFSSIPVPGGTDPGQTKDGNEDEAFLDTEIIGGVAPGAKLVLVRDKSAIAAAQYVIDQNSAALLNVSFSLCEEDLGSYNATVNSMYQQGAAEGITITVSAGDDGVAACEATDDMVGTEAITGFAVNGLASTPYNLAVGGTEFNPLLQQSYWNSSSPAPQASATGHIPEIVWNDTCVNPYWQQFFGFADAPTACNYSGTISGGGFVWNNGNWLAEVFTAGGGLSSCTTTGGGVCTGGYPQPAWQATTIPGVQSFGARALPDVSLAAANWALCSYDSNPCDPSLAADIIDEAGTSAAAPAMAAILALLDQSRISSSSADGRQGLINPLLYTQAGIEYNQAQLLSTCNAGVGGIGISSSCLFYDVTLGNNDVPCVVASFSATSPASAPVGTCTQTLSDPVGVIELNGAVAYQAGTGFDLATGLGSVNAANLISAANAVAPPTGLSASAKGQSVTLTWTAASGAVTSYNVYQGSTSGTESPTPVQTGLTTTSTTVTGLGNGLPFVFEVAAVSAFGVSARSNEASVTIVPAPPTNVTVMPGTQELTVNWTASNGATSYDVLLGTTSGGESSTPVLSEDLATQAMLIVLKPGQKYFVEVVADDAGGSSAPSAEASGTVLPATPTGLTASAGNGSVSLSWSAAAGATSYSVLQGSTAGGEGATPVLTGVSTTSTTISGLANGQKYYFEVVAVDAGGSSAVSNEASATPQAPAPSHGGGASGLLDLLLLGAASAHLVRRRGQRDIHRNCG